MRIAPSRAEVVTRTRRVRRRLLNTGVGAMLLVVAFVAGAYAKWKNWDWAIARTVRGAVTAAPIYAESLVDAEPLENVRLDVKFKHLQQLEAKRAEALALGWLHADDDDFVPATLTVGAAAMPAKIRLKGDGLDHWQGDQWSFRVKVQGDERPFGMRVFSLQHPKSRWFLNEWAFLENLRREDILAVGYRFVNVSFNGADWGIFALEEHFDKMLLESQGRRAGVILAFEEPESFHADAQLRDTGGHVGTWFSHTRNQQIRVFSQSKVQADPVLRDQADEAVEMLRAFQEGRRSASEVFDIARLARFYALADLWRASHASFWCNLRYYYNPVTARLEPIGFDAMALWGDSEHPLIPARRDDYTDNASLRDPIVAAEYLKELRRVADPGYLTELKQQVSPQFDRWRLALQREFPNERRIQPQWDQLAARQAYLRRALNFERQVIAGVRREHGAMFVELRSIALLPVEVVGLRVGDHDIPAGNISTLLPAKEVAAERSAKAADSDAAASAPLVILQPQLPNQPIEVVTLRLCPIPASAESETLYVLTRFVGAELAHAQAVTAAPARRMHGARPNQPTIVEACARHPFLEQSDCDGHLTVRSGAWRVAGDLIMPAGTTLTIPAGTHLSFESGALLYTTGPLHLQGAPDAPVVLDAASGSWSGIIVLDSAERLRWQHAIIRDTASFARGGWMVTGGTTLYRSDASLTSVQFADSSAEDALNVIHAEVDFRDVEFSGCASDAFDGDFIIGTVDGAEFRDIRGDGLDVSGSELNVRNVVARRVVDKAVSVGERSRVAISGLDASTCGFALAAKDGSTATWNQGSARNTHIAVAAYVKKPEFGPAQSTAEGVQILDTPQAALVEIGCRVSVNGTPIAPQDVDVDALYASAPAKPRPGGNAAEPDHDADH